MAKSFNWTTKSLTVKTAKSFTLKMKLSSFNIRLFINWFTFQITNRNDKRNMKNIKNLMK